jgi:hypothetical protein
MPAARRCFGPANAPPKKAGPANTQTQNCCCSGVVDTTAQTMAMEQVSPDKCREHGIYCLFYAAQKVQDNYLEPVREVGLGAEDHCWVCLDCWPAV